mgnify:FL=1
MAELNIINLSMRSRERKQDIDTYKEMLYEMQNGLNRLNEMKKLEGVVSFDGIQSTEIPNIEINRLHNCTRDYYGSINPIVPENLIKNINISLNNPEILHTVRNVCEGYKNKFLHVDDINIKYHRDD